VNAVDQRKNDDVTKLELECGVTLNLQPVKQMIVLEFVGEAGGFDAIRDAALKEKPETLKNFTRLFNYICGWGVTNDVPKYALDDFAMMGGGEYTIRSRWVRQMLTRDEVSQLFAQVVALTFGTDGNG